MAERNEQQPGPLSSTPRSAYEPSGWRAHRSLALALGVVAICYLTLALLLPTEVFWSPDEGTKLLQALSHRRGGARAADIPYGGRGIDPTLTFYPRLLHPRHPAAGLSALYPQPTAEGGVRFHWPVAFPLASLTPYRLMGPGGLYLIPLLGGLVAAAAAGALGRTVDPAASAPAALAVGLCSPVMFYSQLFWEHAPAVALCLAGLLVLAPAHRVVGPRLIGAASLLAGAVALRLESLLLVAVLPLALALVAQRRRLSWSWRRGARWVLLSSLAFAAAVVWLWPGLGTAVLRWLHGRLTEAMSVFGFVVEVRGLWSNPPSRLVEAWFDLGVELGPTVPSGLAWVGTVGALVALGAVLMREPARGWTVAAGGCLAMAPSVWVLCSPQPCRAVHALLLPAPYLALVALLLRPPPGARRRPTLLLGAIVALYLVLGTALAMTKMVGGLEWGNRYLLPLTALGAFSAAAGAVTYGRRDGVRRPRLAVVAVTAACMVTGFGYQLRGAHELLVAKRGLEACRLEVLDAGGPVVTDVYWLPAALTVAFAERPVFVLPGREDLGRWVRRVGSGEDRFRLLSHAEDQDEVRQWLESVPAPRLQLICARPVAGLLVADVAVAAEEGGG